MASQGRLIFPALSPICLFLALGWAGWLPRRLQGRAIWVRPGLLFLLSASAPFTAIRPAYTPAPILTPAEVPTSAQPFGVTYGDVARPAGVRRRREERRGRRVAPGDPLLGSPCADR